MTAFFKRKKQQQQQQASKDAPTAHDGPTRKSNISFHETLRHNNSSTRNMLEANNPVHQPDFDGARYFNN